MTDQLLFENESMRTLRRSAWWSKFALYLLGGVVVALELFAIRIPEIDPTVPWLIAIPFVLLVVFYLASTRFYDKSFRIWNTCFEELPSGERLTFDQIPAVHVIYSTTDLFNLQFGGGSDPRTFVAFELPNKTVTYLFQEKEGPGLPHFSTVLKGLGYSEHENGTVNVVLSKKTGLAVRGSRSYVRT